MLSPIVPVPIPVPIPLPVRGPRFRVVVWVLDLQDGVAMLVARMGIRVLQLRHVVVLREVQVCEYGCGCVGVYGCMWDVCGVGCRDGQRCRSDHEPRRMMRRVWDAGMVTRVDHPTGKEVDIFWARFGRSVLSGRRQGFGSAVAGLPRTRWPLPPW